MRGERGKVEEIVKNPSDFGISDLHRENGALRQNLAREIATDSKLPVSVAKRKRAASVADESLCPGNEAESSPPGKKQRGPGGPDSPICSPICLDTPSPVVGGAPIGSGSKGNSSESVADMCPLGLDAVKIPARGSRCNHKRCFDLSN